MERYKKTGNFAHNLKAIKEKKGMLSVCTLMVLRASPDWKQYD